MESNNSNNRKSARRGLGSFLFGLGGAVLGIVLTLIILSPYTISWPRGSGAQQPGYGQPANQSPSSNMSRLGFDNTNINDGGNISSAAARIVPSVVGITTTKIERDLYSRARRVQGVGSGIIVTPTGYILTNNHVAGRDAEYIVVSLFDGREVSGRTVWADPSQDLAIVKIDADNLTVAALGDSNSVKIGQQAIAIGNPLGLTFQRTVTAGIISAINRTIEVERGVFMEDLLQTDASINPGNSGGPLINIKGEVVGINSIKVTTAEGMGFAVPINVIKPIINRYAATGNYESPDFKLQTFGKELSSLYNFTAAEGVYVYDCPDGTCAYKAGLRKGDIILSINDRIVTKPSELREAIYAAGANQTVKIRIKSKQGIEREVTIKLDGKK